MKTMSKDTVSINPKLIVNPPKPTDSTSISFSGNTTINADVTINGKQYKVSMRLEKITPDMANKYLADLHYRQRKLRPTRVRQLGIELAELRAHLTGDALIFVNGKLIQGQHRCNAIIVANVPMIMWVMESNDEHLYEVLDKGLARTFPDLIDKDSECPRDISSQINFVGLYDQTVNGKGKMTLIGGDVLHCPGRKVGYYNEHQKNLIESILIAKEDKNVHFSNGCGGAFLHLAWRNSPDKEVATEFIKQIISGTNIKDNTPFHTFYKWLENYTRADCRPKQEMILGQMIKAFNAQQTNTTYTPPKRLYKKKISAEDKKFPLFYWQKVNDMDPKYTNYFPVTV
jgi:hypothetical protein